MFRPVARDSITAANSVTREKIAVNLGRHWSALQSSLSFEKF